MRESKITALYERLSVEDERSGESVPIENQKAFLIECLAEDMAKGVFVPVSTLPKQEPRKAPSRTPNKASQAV